MCTSWNKQLPNIVSTCCRKWEGDLVPEACDLLAKELSISPGVRGGMESYRNTLSLSFFFKFYLTVQTKRDSNQVKDQLKRLLDRKLQFFYCLLSIAVLNLDSFYNKLNFLLSRYYWYLKHDFIVELAYCLNLENYQPLACHCKYIMPSLLLPHFISSNIIA